jgi:hypothetical protein
MGADYEVARLTRERRFPRRREGGRPVLVEHIKDGFFELNEQVG